MDAAEAAAGARLSPVCRALLADHPVLDAHVDALQRMLDLGHDLGVAGPGQFDLVRARAGGLGAVVLVCWCDPRWIDAEGGAFARTLALLEAFHALLARHPERARFAGNGADVQSARAAGVVAAIAGIEGGHSIEGSLEKLALFFDRGVRVLTLVWNNHLPWVRSCQDGAGPEVPSGLSRFGREVVREMNRLGMLVDLSHAGERAFYDALDASSAPVLASHSGCRALHDHPRNLSDAQLRALAANGGVLGIVFHPGFLDAEARAEEARVRASAAYRELAGASDPALAGASDTALFLRQSEHLARAARPLDAERVADHVAHAAGVMGAEHVGLGSDFDGIQRGPRGLEDAACYGNLAELLLARGFTADEARGVLGANVERLFARVTGPETEAGALASAPRASVTPAPARTPRDPRALRP